MYLKETKNVFFESVQCFNFVLFVSILKIQMLKILDFFPLSYLINLHLNVESFFFHVQVNLFLLFYNANSYNRNNLNIAKPGQKLSFLPVTLNKVGPNEVQSKCLIYLSKSSFGHNLCYYIEFIVYI